LSTLQAHIKVALWLIETKEAQGSGLKTCHQHLFLLLFV